MRSLVHLNKVSFNYPDRKEIVLEQIDWEIKEGDFIALIGPNGSGKTTLVKLILSLLFPRSGSVERMLPITDIGYIPQRYSIGKNFPGTVEEIFSAWGKNNRLSKEAEEDREIFSQIRHLYNKRFIDLSGGEQQRVLLALALRKNPRLLILDEPTAGVDAAFRSSFYQLLYNLNREGIGIILVTHDHFLPSSVNQIFYMDHPHYIGSLETMKPILERMGIGFALT